MTNYLQPNKKVQQNGAVVTVRGKQRTFELRVGATIYKIDPCNNEKQKERTLPN